MLFQSKNKKSNLGLTLIEVVIAIAIFLMIGVAIYNAYVGMFKMITGARVQLIATALANEQMEIIRNMPYQDVGLQDGVPAGALSRFQTLTRDGVSFSVRLSISDIDNPFDGQIGSTTYPDLAPNDYKLVEAEISCPTCQNLQPFTISTYVAPKNLENNSGNGALFVQVLDANGAPVTLADVNIVLASSTNPVNINERTNQSGFFQLVNTYPANLAYQIIVSKTGYSSERTYASGEAGIANPVKLNATVVAGQVTQLSFGIDRLANLELKTMTKTCTPIASVPITWQGTKLLGTNPNVLKVDQTLSTDAGGKLILNNIEWDTYRFSASLSGYALVGSLPLQSLNIAPASNNDIKIVLAPSTGRGLLVSVRDGASSLPLSDATVSISGPSPSQSLITNQGFWVQSDWSAGAGQTYWSALDKFATSDGNIDYASTTGQLSLVKTGATYVSSGYLESSIFDTGSATTSYIQLAISPSTQASTTGAGSVRLQLASSNDQATTTWNYTGPDGTDQTFYNATSTTINAVVNNNRYLRYKLYLQTADLNVSPTISDISLTYSSECLPFGQVFFDNLNNGTYTVTVSHDAYQDFGTTFNVNDTWQFLEIPLNAL